MPEPLLEVRHLSLHYHPHRHEVLRAVDDVIDLAAHAARGAVAELHDLRAGLHQSTQDRALAHDLGVVGGVGRGRHRRDQGV